MGGQPDERSLLGHRRIQMPSHQYFIADIPHVNFQGFYDNVIPARRRRRLRARAGAQVLLAIEERRLLSRVVFLPLHLPGDNRSRGRDYRVIFSDHTESPRGSWISSNELSLVDESNCGYLRPRKFYAARA